MSDRQNAETLAATPLTASAIIPADAEERGMAHWTALADRLCVEAARQAAERIEAAS